MKIRLVKQELIPPVTPENSWYKIEKEDKLIEWDFVEGRFFSNDELAEKWFNEYQMRYPSIKNTVLKETEVLL